jgi:hypothetical protein
MGNVYAANQVVDTTKSPTTFIDTTANGVDLINIANPNSVGVSVNHYNTKPLGLAITTAAFLPNTSKAPFNTERLVEPTSFRIISLSTLPN